MEVKFSILFVTGPLLVLRSHSLHFKDANHLWKSPVWNQLRVSKSSVKLYTQTQFEGKQVQSSASTPLWKTFINQTIKQRFDLWSLQLICRHQMINMSFSLCFFPLSPVNGFHPGGSPLHHVEHAHNSLVRKSSTEPQVRLSDGSHSYSSTTWQWTWAVLMPHYHYYINVNIIYISINLDNPWCHQTKHLRETPEERWLTECNEAG